MSRQIEPIMKTRLCNRPKKPEAHGISMRLAVLLDGPVNRRGVPTPIGELSY
jgi:hypothetical protein